MDLNDNLSDWSPNCAASSAVRAIFLLSTGTKSNSVSVAAIDTEARLVIRNLSEKKKTPMQSQKQCLNKIIQSDLAHLAGATRSGSNPELKDVRPYVVSLLMVQAIERANLKLRITEKSTADHLQCMSLSTSCVLCMSLSHFLLFSAVRVP